MEDLNNEQLKNLIVSFCEKNPSEARQIFKDIISSISDRDEIAKIEFFCEYHTNPTFKKSVSELVYSLVS